MYAKIKTLVPKDYFEIHSKKVSEIIDEMTSLDVYANLLGIFQCFLRL